MVAKRTDDDVPDLRPRPSPWPYLAYTALGGAVAFWTLVFIIAYGSDERVPGWAYLLFLGGAALMLFGLIGLPVALVRRRTRD